jgi:uncharacterized membrane protein YgdD (TMEM256/DUF423 family)
MNWSAIGAVFLALAVILGAFGAHGLKDKLDAYSLGVWEKAVFYHFIHAMGVLVVSLLPRGNFPAAGASLVAWLLTAGILIFSGSLYLLAVTGAHTLGAVTPIGGVCFIAAWLLLAYYFIAQRV